MLDLTVTLRCERAGCDSELSTTLRVAEGRDVAAKRIRPALDALEARAWHSGWGRIRATPTGPLGHYCPGCVRILADARGREVADS